MKSELSSLRTYAVLAVLLLAKCVNKCQHLNLMTLFVSPAVMFV